MWDLRCWMAAAAAAVARAPWPMPGFQTQACQLRCACPFLQPQQHHHAAHPEPLGQDEIQWLVGAGQGRRAWLAASGSKK